MIGLAKAREWIEQRAACLPAETIPLAAACGRVLADGRAPLAPVARVAAIDGLAVRAGMTEGASDYAPIPVACVPIVAGTKLPPGMDAVLPPHLVEAGLALAPAAAGEGVSPHDPLELLAKCVLGPGELAALALRGETEVEVVRTPLVRLRVAAPKAGADALTPMLRALIASCGGRIGEKPNLVIHAGRSGSGPDDDGALAFDTLFAHGIRVRPGETSALGEIDGVSALLLPGDPLACLVAFALFAAPALRRLGGRPEPAPLQGKLVRKIVSGLGQVDAVRVVATLGVVLPSSPSLTTAADGLLLVPEGSEGYPAGATVAISPLP